MVMSLVGLYAILSLRLKDPEIAGGYVPRLHIHDNICLGQAIFADEEGKACIINAERSSKSRYPLPIS